MTWTFYSNGGIKTAPISSLGNAVRAVRSGTSQSISTGTWTAVTLPTETYDYGDLHSTVTNSERLTAQVEGIYVITGFVTWAADTSNDRGVRIDLNGSTIAMHIGPTTTAAFQCRQSIATQHYMTAGDYVDMKVWQGTGAALNIDSAFFSMCLMTPVVFV